MHVRRTRTSRFAPHFASAQARRLGSHGFRSVTIVPSIKPAKNDCPTRVPRQRLPLGTNCGGAAGQGATNVRFGRSAMNRDLFVILGNTAHLANGTLAVDFAFRGALRACEDRPGRGRAAFGGYRLLRRTNAWRHTHRPPGGCLRTNRRFQCCRGPPGLARTRSPRPSIPSKEGTRTSPQERFR